MARINLEHIRHAYGERPKSEADYALKEVHHEWNDGGAYALLGPSGCGKTTLLNIISGLLQPSEGRILFDGRDVTRLSTQQRNIAQVFQFPVIYDTMTVYDNLAFPLRNRRVPEAEVDRRVTEIIDMIGLGGWARKTARGLTADQTQKISLGREGMHVRVNKVEDIGRQKIVRAEFAGKQIAIVLSEDGEIPADPRVTFDPSAINIYADSWRVGREA